MSKGLRKRSSEEGGCGVAKMKPKYHKKTAKVSFSSGNKHHMANKLKEKPVQTDRLR